MAMTASHNPRATAARPRGRWAPSPSGWLHVGNARTALVAWLSVRSRGGTFLWRLEDLDPPRAVPWAAQGALDDLGWLGLDWDEGPDVGGPCGPYRQSERTSYYEAALARLHAAGRLFPCRRSRKELADLARAPHEADTGPPYPPSLRPKALAPGWFERALQGGPGSAALRFRVSPEPVEIHDRLLGHSEERVSETVGDFVLRRRDGLWAYQLAVVVDDLAMGIDDVVRGQDLATSTARQIQLLEALGGRPPLYAHVPLVCNAQREKLSKRDRGLELRALRERGVSAERLTGYLAWSLGLAEHPRPLRPRELVEGFAWERLRREDWQLPADLASDLLGELPGKLLGKLVGTTALRRKRPHGEG